MTVVSEWVSVKFQVLEKFLNPVTGKCFLVLMLYFMLDGLILFCKGDFCGVRYLYDDFFKGGILGSACNIRGDPT